ncbi:MAG TPA: PAS domain S-box protein, partial [Mucilaginibacter sp.]|nr:PAS domain S-box protein [Mucilaginibacter sp.]
MGDFISVAMVTILLYFMIKGQNKRLENSEEQYRRLFELNPNPMWIYRTNDLRFIKVNQSAVDLYGYSKDEFLIMDILGIRPESDHEKLLDCLGNMAEAGVNKSGNWRHLKKNGELLYASIVTYDLQFNNDACRLVMVTDITDIILKEEKIKAQNIALHEIAWSNSHEIRRSLCSVMSLTALLRDAVNESERREYLLLLQ